MEEFLNNNEIVNSFDRGCFLHLVTDYLFYNYYLEYYSKQEMYHDYDVLNKRLIEKYKVVLPNIIKDKVYYIEGETKILKYDLAIKIIEEISGMDLDKIAKEVKEKRKEWNRYKKLV